MNSGKKTAKKKKRGDIRREKVSGWTHIFIVLSMSGTLILHDVFNEHETILFDNMSPELGFLTSVWTR